MPPKYLQISSIERKTKEGGNVKYRKSSHALWAGTGHRSIPRVIITAEVG